MEGRCDVLGLVAQCHLLDLRSSLLVLQQKIEGGGDGKVELDIGTDICECE